MMTYFLFLKYGHAFLIKFSLHLKVYMHSLLIDDLKTNFQYDIEKYNLYT